VWCPPKCRIPLGRCFCLSHFSGPCFSERTRGESLALPLPSPICSAFRTDAGELHTHTPHHARRSRPREEREGESESGCTAQVCCAAFVPSFWCKLVRLLGQQESAGRDFQTRHGRSLQAVLKNREECDRGRSLEARPFVAPGQDVRRPFRRRQTPHSFGCSKYTAPVERNREIAFRVQERALFPAIEFEERG